MILTIISFGTTDISGVLHHSYCLVRGSNILVLVVFQDVGWLNTLKALGRSFSPVYLQCFYSSVGAMLL